MTKPRGDKAVEPIKREPLSFEKLRIEAASRFGKAKATSGKAPVAVQFDGKNENGAVVVAATHSDKVGHLMALNQTFGTMSNEFVTHQLGRLLAVVRNRDQAVPDETAINSALAAVGAVEPENETEASIAIQMAGTHDVAMEMLTRAKQAHDPGMIERYGTLATKLLRTYGIQAESLAKIRRGGAQRVVVEHVHVYQGGQAIVGNVTHGGGAHIEKGHQPHALSGPAALAVQSDASMLCEDAGREPVPAAGGGGQETLPNARRGRRKRSPER